MRAFFPRLFAVLCLLVFGFVCSSATWAQETISDDPLVGLWKAQETYFRPLIRFEQSNTGQLEAFLTTETTKQGSPFSKTVFQNDSLLLQLNADVHFRGTWLDDSDVIKGTWTQADQSAIITLQRVDPASLSASADDIPARPQHPEPPYPYATEDITFQNGHDGTRLAGTLTLPEGPGPFPAVVLLTGTGANNRDYEISGHRLFLVLADHLTRQGIATFRYDKRGVAESGGSLTSAHFDDLVQDAAAALRYLKTRTDVDAQNTGLVGHSVGTSVALQVNAQVEDAAFLALLMPPSLPGHDVFVEQHARIWSASGASPSEVDSVRTAMRHFFDVLRMDADSVEVAAQVRSIFEKEGRTGEQLQMRIEANTAPWFREIMRYDARPRLRKAEIPVLAVFGTHDLFVPSDQNEPALRAALAESKSPDKTVRTFDGVNHWLQPAETGLPDEISTIEVTIAPDVLNTLTDWLLTQTANE